MPIVQPNGNVKLSNVSHVRMRKGKRRYEIVCYQNKVQDWRKGIEKDLDEVLQVPQVFVNVSKGEVANTAELQKAFGKTDMQEIVLEILNKGELQVGGKERQQQQTQQHHKVLELVAAKCVNPRTSKPYPPSILEKTLHELGFQYPASKPVKGQALDAIKLLVEKQVIPIARARMRVRITDDPANTARYGEEVRGRVEVESEQEVDGIQELTGLIDPGDFRWLDETVREQSEGLGMVEVLAMDY